MAIQLTPDLEARVERLATLLGMNGNGSRTAVLERAIAALEEQTPEPHGMTPDEIKASLREFGRDADLIEAELADDPELDHSKPMSQALQDVLYDEHGLPK